MEDFNSKYTGEEVENILDSVGGKQDKIADLATIRSGAEKGATAVQPGDIEDVARLDEEYVVANGIVSKQDVYYHLPDITTDDTAHTLATKDDVSLAVETYIADFTMGSLREGIYDGVNVDCNVQGLVDAMNANKIILVREIEDSSCKGVYVLNGYAEDLLYFSIVDTFGNILWCEGTDYKSLQGIDARTLYERSWDYKQDELVSGENIKTINGESIVGSGNITITGGSGTITGVSANGTSIATSGVANIPAASTSKYGVTKLTTLTNSSSTTLAATASAVKSAYDLANGKQDKLVSGTNIKTINGTSILGSGNIVISGGGSSSSGGSGAYAEVSHGTGDTIFTLTPNTFHIWDEVASLTLDLGSETSGVANEYLFQFTSGATATSLTLPDDIKWANATPPTIAENMIYQVSILKGLASVLEWDSVVSIFPITLVANTTTDAGKRVYVELEKLGESGELEVGLLHVYLTGNTIGVTTFAFDSTRNAYRLTWAMTSVFLDSSGYCYVVVID